MTYSVKDLAERYGVSVHTVLAWLKNGTLRGFNVARDADGKRPRWRVGEAALVEFEALRTPTPTPRAGRRRRQSADIVEFYTT